VQLGIRGEAQRAHATGDAPRDAAVRRVGRDGHADRAPVLYRRAHAHFHALRRAACNHVTAVVEHVAELSGREVRLGLAAADADLPDVLGARLLARHPARQHRDAARAARDPAPAAAGARGGLEAAVGLDVDALVGRDGDRVVALAALDDQERDDA